MRGAAQACGSARAAAEEARLSREEVLKVGAASGGAQRVCRWGAEACTGEVAGADVGAAAARL